MPPHFAPVCSACASQLFQNRGENDLLTQLEEAQLLEEEVAQLKLAREQKIAALKETAAESGTKGMLAQHELKQLLATDDSEMKEKETRIKALRQRAEKAVTTQDPFEAQRKLREKEEVERKAREIADRKEAAQRLRNRGSAFGL